MIWVWKPLKKDDDPSEDAALPRSKELIVARKLLGRIQNVDSQAVYRRDLNSFMSWWQGDHLARIEADPDEDPRTPVDANRDDLEAYLRHMNDLEMYSAATINRRLAVVSSFYETSADADYRGDNPALRLKRPKVDNTSARTGLSKADAGDFITEADSWEDRAEGTLAILLLLQGLRISEAIGLQTDDVARDGGRLKLDVKRKGMGGKSAIVVDDAELVERIEELCDLQDKEARPVFGETTRFDAVRSVARIGIAAGIDPPPHPHLLRHTFIAHAIRLEGLSIEDVRDLAGHASIETTQRYARAVAMEERAVGASLRAGFVEAQRERVASNS